MFLFSAPLVNPGSWTLPDATWVFEHFLQTRTDLPSITCAQLYNCIVWYYSVVVNLDILPPFPTPPGSGGLVLPPPPRRTGYSPTPIPMPAPWWLAGRLGWLFVFVHFQTLSFHGGP